MSIRTPQDYRHKLKAAKKEVSQLRLVLGGVIAGLIVAAIIVNPATQGSFPKWAFLTCFLFAFGFYFARKRWLEHRLDREWSDYLYKIPWNDHEAHERAFKERDRIEKELHGPFL